MKILSIQNNNAYSFQYKQKNMNFTSYRKEVFYNDVNGRTIENLKHTTATWMLRKGPDWKKLTAFLAEKYRNVQKVNVYDYACSNGSEAYTFLITMLNDCGYDITKKFTPVIAKDYDGGAIYRAQSGRIKLDADEISDIENYTDGNFDRFFCSKYLDSKYNIRTWDVKPILTTNVEYSVADILDDYKNIKPNNSVVFVRNFWPYLDLKDREMLINGLFSQLGNNSLLITGIFDKNDPINKRPIDNDLLSAGFKKSKVDYVFEK